MWSWDWLCYENTKGKIILGRDYYEKLSEVRKLKGVEGEDVFTKEYKQIYAPELYERDVEKLKEIGKSLEGMGFKVKLDYSKDYKQCSLDKEPESLWITLSW